MKKILLIMATMVLVAGANAASKNEIKQNYKMCLDFTGEVDPKHPQINFEECDKWIDMYEHPKKYAEQNAEQNKKKSFALKFKDTRYLKYYNDDVKIKKIDEFGETYYVKKNKAVYELEKELNLKNNLIFLGEIVTYELLKWKTKNSFNSKDERYLYISVVQAGIQGAISGGHLPSSLNIGIYNTTQKARTTTMSVDIYNIGSKLAWYLRGNSKKMQINRTLLIHTFLVTKYPYIIDYLSPVDTLEGLVQLLQKNDKETVIFMNYILNKEYVKASKYLLSLKRVKYNYQQMKKASEKVKKMMGAEI